MSRSVSILFLCALAAIGCGSGGVRPVEFYPEDMCAACRMAISDARFASEIIDADGTALKFDDIGCLLSYRAKLKPSAIAAVYLKDYETLEWVPYEKSTIVETGVATPMASGRLAFSSSERATAFARSHPPEDTAAGCCGEGGH